MELVWIQTEEEQRENIVAKGKEITELAHKFWNDEPLSEIDKYQIARSLFWLGKDMTTRSSRYIPPKPRGRVSEIPSFDILTEFYSYTFVEKNSKTYAYDQLIEKYNISM
ncbi:MAG: hypothetical protein L0G10_16050, partial [Acinetobacter sp.]|nr:hypothetical protein [Acinetobacter sp.]